LYPVCSVPYNDSGPFSLTTEFFANEGQRDKPFSSAHAR